MTRPALPAAFLTTPIAHRALHDSQAGIPENSLAAIAAAITAGYGIEIDVQLSADDEAMVFHDRDLDRMTAQTGAVRARAVSELERIDLAGSADPIPRLARALELVDGRTPVLIEIKDQSIEGGPGFGPLERAVAGALEGYPGPAAVMSFAPGAMAEMARAAPRLARGLVTCRFDECHTPGLGAQDRRALREIRAFDRVEASFISHDAADLDRPRVRELREAGWPVLCWTVRSADMEIKARKGADNITFEGYRPPLTAGIDAPPQATQ